MIRTLLRSVTLAFSLLTCGYALLCASAFTFHDVIRSDMFAVRAVARWYPWAYVAWLVVAIADIKVALPGRARSQWSFAVVWAAVGVWIAIHPVLGSLVDDWRSFVVAVAALAPAVWLAAADHVAALPFLVDSRHVWTADDVDTTEGRLVVAVAATAIFVSIAFAMLVPVLAAGEFEPDLLTGGLVIGLAWSVVEHAVPFAALLVAMALVLRVSARLGVAGQYLVMFGLVVAAAALGIDRAVCQVLGFDGIWRGVVALSMAIAIVGTVVALALRDAEREGLRLTSALDVFGGAFHPRALGRRVALQLAAVVALAFVAARISRRADWDFLLLLTSVLLLWIAAFRAILRASPPRRVGGVALAATCVLPMVLWSVAERVQTRWPAVDLALTRYIIYNPSFRFVERLLPRAEAAGNPGFQRFLRDNTALAGLEIEPIDLDFVAPLAAAPRQPPPNIFLFVIDSLRPDYLAPYNTAVTFTPRIQQFAGESVVFRNAMTRYGATGLSLPAIWSGAVGVHRQYVMPFSPMNTFEKLLIANRYHRIMSVDVLMGPLLSPWSDTIELDRDRRTLDYDLCRTLGELETRLSDSGGEPGPVFAYSNPQNLHLSNLMTASVPAGEHYPGFHAPYATRVHDIDRCFGAFIDTLKAKQIYDRSLVVLTADHGELLGEEGRWGHAYYLFPPILQIPLIVHLPADAREWTAPDTSALAFTTDIAPTIYAALGYRPHPGNALMGEALVGPTRVDPHVRRRGDYVVEASYSSVYGVVRRNGRRVYIVDAVSGREYAYDRDRSGSWSAVAVTDGLRAAAQRIIRQHIDDVRRLYHLAPYGGEAHQG